MKSAWLRRFVLAAVLLAPSGCGVSYDPAVTLPYLASDQLEGRGVGTPGLETAANYIADHYRRAGLKPLPGLDGYFQPFDFVTSRKPAVNCALLIAGRSLTLDKDYRPLAISGEGAFAGPVVFAGYGITSAANSYDDYAGLDVHGKVVLAMRFEPMDAEHKSLFAPIGFDWSDDARLENKIQTARKHGAAALILITPAGLQSSDPLTPFAPSSAASLGLPTIHVKRAAVEAILFDGIHYDSSGKPIAQVRAGVVATGNVQITRTTVRVENVAACVPGAGPHADQYVIVGAHYDHLGRGAWGGILGPRGAIYHGADDNASGTATLLELAQRAAAGPPRQRTVVFCSFTAEEEGLIGSRYFTAHPPLDLHRVVAMLNMDMVGRMKGNVIYVGGRGTAADLDAVVKRAADNGEVAVRPLPVGVGGRGGLGPSDHMSFALQKIPVLMLFSGMHADYHRPSDTAEKINYTGIQKTADFAGRLIDGLSAMDREPYDASSDIASMTIGIVPASNDHLPGAALGIVAGYPADDTETGVPVRVVSSGSAAAAAGVQGGDVIRQWNGQDMIGLADLAQHLATSHAGDIVTLKVQRGSKMLLLHAKLDERKE